MAEAAVALIEREGVERLTMRARAGELDCGTMTLYTHVRNREDLFAAVIEELIEGLDVPAVVARPHRSWQDLLRDMHRAYRDIAGRFPRSFELLALAPYDLQPVTPHLDGIVASLEAFGLDYEQALTALRVSDSFATGHLLVHARRGEGSRGTDDGADFERGIEIVLTGLATAFSDA